MPGISAGPTPTFDGSSSQAHQLVLSLIIIIIIIIIIIKTDTIIFSFRLARENS